MTVRFRFSKSDLITTAGVAMRPLEIDDKGGLFERLGQPGITERHSHEELADLLRRPDTTYIAGYFDRKAQEIRGRKPVDVINELREAVRRLVIWRKAFCDAFLYLESLGFINRTHEGYMKERERLSAGTAGDSTMSNDIIRKTAEKVAALRDHFIHHERFEPLQARFAMLVAKRLSDLDAGRSSEAHGLTLSGPSGTGKSAAMNHLLADASQQLSTIRHFEAPIISLRVPSPATLKFVGYTLLRALGYQISSERQAWYIWDWTCLGKVPVSLLFHAAFFSKATGLFPARAECRRLGL